MELFSLNSEVVKLQLLNPARELILLLLKPHRLAHIQSHEVISDLLCPHSGQSLLKFMSKYHSVRWAVEGECLLIFPTRKDKEAYVAKKRNTYDLIATKLIFWGWTCFGSDCWVSKCRDLALREGRLISIVTLVFFFPSSWMKEEGIWEKCGRKSCVRNSWFVFTGLICF